jgi:hypoxanthine phosphoribosyltransferase
MTHEATSDLTDPAAPPLPAAHRGPGFAHASEAEMARILDFYGVAWQYEPHTFPILWNLDGGVVESFSPDFYLPELDLYLELTTLRQRLVRKKNRKLRRLRELYPDLRIKLFYARDFRALMLKYGKLALVDALSGTPGQVVPVRPEAPPLAPNPLEPDSLGPSEPALAAAPEPPPSAPPAPRPRASRRRGQAGPRHGREVTP